jgi:3-oxoacyl-[acyl-carrier protein] reductase
MQIIRGKRALVTGAAAGIGRAIALALAREGADLVLVDIDEAGLEATADTVKGHGVEVMTVVCDLREPAQISAMVKSLLASGDRLNILVNNAGVAYYGPTHEMSAEQWRRLLAVNLLAPIQLVHELVPLLAAQDEAHILNMCSIFGLITLRKAAAYQASKSGLVGFTLALRAEYCRPGFGVSALCPGFVRTALIESFEAGAGQTRHTIPHWATTSPERIATIAMRAIRRDKGLVVISPLARLLWWLTRLAPGLADWLAREGWRRRRRLQIGRN